MGLKETFSKIRHNLGESFLHAIDDVRQKFIEEPWSGNPQTAIHQLNYQYSDFAAWLYGHGKSETAAMHSEPSRQRDTVADWLKRPDDRNLDAAYDSAFAGFRHRCEQAGIDPTDRAVVAKFQDAFWQYWINGSGREAWDHGPSQKSSSIGDDGGLEM